MKYYPKKDYSSNLIAKWIFDDTNSDYINGNIIKDLSGKGNNLTAYNITYQNDTDLGRCAYFNGTDSYMMANNPVIPVGKKSILIKLKTNDNPSVLSTLLDNNSWSANKYGSSILLRNGGIITFNTYNNESNAISGINTQITVNNNISHTIIFTTDNTININCLKSYVDNLLTPKQLNSNVKPETNSASYNLSIGRLNNTLNYFYKGFIQSIEIYNEVVEFTDKKYLIQDKSSVLYTFNGTKIVNSNSQTLDEKNFKDNGFTDMSLLQSDEFKAKFNNMEDIKLLMWTDDLEKKEVKMNCECKPFELTDWLKKEQCKLLVYTDDIEKEDCNMKYDCEPYKPLDKLNDEFDIVMLES